VLMWLAFVLTMVAAPAALADDDPANAPFPDPLPGQLEEDAEDEDGAKAPAAQPEILEEGGVDVAPSPPRTTKAGKVAPDESSTLLLPGIVTWVTSAMAAAGGWALGAAILALGVVAGTGPLAFSPCGPGAVCCGIGGVLAIAMAAPAGQGVLAVAGWESMTQDNLDLVLPILAAYTSCLSLSVAGVVFTAATLGLGALWVTVVSRNRVPNPNALFAAGTALPLTVGVVVALLQPTLLTATIGWSALRSRPSRAREEGAGPPSAPQAMRF
jgi:hypothetical protein